MASNALSGAYATWKAGAPVAAPSMKEAGGRMAVNLASMLGITPEVTGAYRAAGGDVMNPAFRTAQLKGMMGAIPLAGMAVIKGPLGPITFYKGLSNPSEVLDPKNLNRREAFPTFGGERPTIDGVKTFVAEDPKIANRFAYGKSAAIMPVHLDYSRPYVIDAKGKKSGDIQFGKSGKEFQDAVSSGKYDAIEIKNTADEGNIVAVLDGGKVFSKYSNE